MAFQHPLDPRRAHASFQPLDHPFVANEQESRHDVDLQPARDLGVPSHVDALNAEAGSFLAREVRDQAVHPSGRP
ncbi:MAG TPA: hypothetical protein VJT84_03670 [Gaiellaceae bacterium]|nr:hypothetical protein [Gaiellaceae bacterium]